MRAKGTGILLTLDRDVSSSRASAAAVDIRDTRLLTDPAVSATHVAFSYANDLWVVRIDGTDVRRLTSHPGEERSPRFSPDGRLLAFTGKYDGNEDVFVVSVDGGVPRRLTWHPDADVVLGFTPDGGSILFTSQRDVHTPRFSQALHGSRRTGGIPEKHPLPVAWNASFSPDGRKLAYMPVYEAFRQWKNYRGGTAGRIVIFDNETHETEQIPQPEGRSNDTMPMWMGDRIYFLSDRNGEFNLFSFDPASKQVEQLTTHTDFPVLSASAGARPNRLRAGRLPSPVRPVDPRDEAPDNRRRRRSSRAQVPLGLGREVRQERRDLALRRAGGHRVPRGDRHRARREGRSAQHHRVAGRARPLARVVA
jgi:WD40 repeat protein